MRLIEQKTMTTGCHTVRLAQYVNSPKHISFSQRMMGTGAGSHSCAAWNEEGRPAAHTGRVQMQRQRFVSERARRHTQQWVFLGMKSGCETVLKKHTHSVPVLVRVNEAEVQLLPGWTDSCVSASLCCERTSHSDPHPHPTWCLKAPTSGHEVKIKKVKIMIIASKSGWKVK